MQDDNPNQKRTRQKAPLGETQADKQSPEAPGEDDRRRMKGGEEDEDRVPREGRPEFLNDLSGDGGGQMSEVGVPYNGEGEVRRGVEKEQHQGTGSKTEP